jgi:hypothetical protein
VAPTRKEIGMTHRRKLALVLTTVVGVSAGGLGIAQAVGREADRASAPDADVGAPAPGASGVARTAADDADEPVGGAEAERAGRAAVDSIGGGRVVGVEREDERGVSWEVEVLQRDGRELEVELDGNLERVAIDHEDAGADDESTDGDRASEGERDD